MKNYKVTMLASVVALALTTPWPAAQADETCASPYMKKITGQEDFVYVWTLGQEGVGDGQDKLVTVDVNPKSDRYGKVIGSLSVGGVTRLIIRISPMIGTFCGRAVSIPARFLSSTSIPTHRNPS